MKCDPSHLFGWWLIESARLQDYVEQARAMLAVGDKRIGVFDDEKSYDVMDGGLAVIPLSGPLTKYRTSFAAILGGTSMEFARRQLAEAVDDARVRGAILVVDSPGGTVAGTADLAEAVRRFKARKPVYAYVSDLSASAAYWVASQAGRIFANRTAVVGSIGVVTALYDESKRFAAEGVKVHVVSTGVHKGVGIPGAKISDEQIEEVQKRVDALNAVFVEEVARGRGMTDESVRALADGRVFVGDDGVRVGLVDELAYWDDALASIRTEITKMNDPVGTFAAAHPEAVEKWKGEGFAKGAEQGKAEGKTEGASAERKRFVELAAAFPDRPGFVCEQFAKGATVPEAKGALADVLQAELKAEHEKVVALEKRAESGSPGVPFSGSGNGGFDRKKIRSADVDAEHDRQWQDERVRKEFSNNRAAHRNWLLSEALENERVASVRN